MITPYACMPDTRAAIDFYVAAFGAQVSVEPMVMDDGRIGHAEITMGDARVMMSDPYPELHVVAPAPEGASVTLYLDVADVDATTDRAVAAGAVLDRDRRIPTTAGWPSSATRPGTAGCCTRSDRALRPSGGRHLGVNTHPGREPTCGPATQPRRNSASSASHSQVSYSCGDQPRRPTSSS